MNKILKYAISSTMIVSAFSMVNFNEGLSIGCINAYASSSYLTSLSMGSDKLYENDNYTNELEDGDDIKSTYYAKLSSSDSDVTISTSADSDCVSIVKSKGKKKYKPGDDIPILVGKTVLTVKVYDSKEDCEEDKNCQKQYKINIKKYSSEEEKEISNDVQDNVYLRSLELDYGDIPLGFNRNKTNYDVTVDKETKTLAIKAVPDDGSYDVRVNGIKLDEDKEYKKMINLSEDTTKVEVSVCYDDDEKRTYVINISRNGTSKAENTSSDNESSDQQKNDSVKTETKKDNAETTIKNENSSNTNDIVNNKNDDIYVNSSVNYSGTGWVSDDGKWKYTDDYGNILKSTWFYDRNQNNTYYFDENGYLRKGWITLNNDSYYLDENGAMFTGWKNVNGSWYYLNYDGKMKKGWIRDTDGNYYYLNESTGAMEVNTTVNGYKLGNNGAWIK